MSSETSCPSCGSPLPPQRATPTVSHSITHCAESPGPTASDPAPTTSRAPDLGPFPADSNTNFDMPTLKDLGPSSEPDPLLGEFDPTDPAPSLDLAPSASDPDEFELPSPHTGTDDAEVTSPGPLGIDISLPGASRSAELLPESVDGPGDEPVRGSGLPRVLLVSYASAMTLAVGWLMLDRRGRSAESEPPAAAATAQGKREGQGRAVALEEIPAERVTTLGRTIRVGSLEIEPLAVEMRSVRLVPIRPPLIGEARPPREGGQALALKLRLRNLSDRSSFFPLDEAYLREGDRGPIDSFIEVNGSERIYLYPLAVESEWRIDGQEFRELRPLESYEALIVSEPEPAAEAERVRWRLRLRVAADRTETIIVQTPTP